MKLTRSDILLLAAALKALDARMVMEKDSDGKAHAISKPYDFGKGVRYASARMQAALKAQLEEINDLRRALFVEHAQGQTEISGAAAQAFESAWNQALREQVDFTEHRFEISALKIETNALDPSVIAALLPILDGEI